MPMILPGVMEISAPRPDEEVEERERLRDAAAQSIGLGPEMLQETQSRDDSIEELDEDEGNEQEDREEGYEMLDPPATISRSGRSSSMSSTPAATHPVGGRRRSGSLAQSLTHVRTRSSTNASSVPAFPTTPSALKQSIVMAAVLPKYHPPSSLLIFALSKQWKGRYMVLSSPSLPSSRGQAPSVSYLHLFKSSSSEEKELERLEINEDSVVFVAEEEVGGRRGVVKVGGLDVGAVKKELNQEIGGRTMWFLQILDQGEGQKWIAAIKSAILGQRYVPCKFKLHLASMLMTNPRSMRAGLGLPAHTLEGNEPRGDMDVMLTMRAQGIISSPVPKRATMPEFVSLRSQSTTPSQVSAVPDASLRSSPLSTRSQATSHKPPPTGAVSAIKGLFTASTRPRSPSRATSIKQEVETAEDSFGMMGNNLMSMRPSTSSADAASSSASSAPVIPSIVIPIPPSTYSPAEQVIDRKITNDLPTINWSDYSDPKPKANRQNRALSVGALSPLQPPPHRRTWVPHGPKKSTADDSNLYKLHGNGSVAGNFGLAPPEEVVTPPPASPISLISTNTNDQRVRAGSLHSVSTVASFELGPKRWSRQGVLPKRLTPPSGPPPAVPEGHPSQSGHRPLSWLQNQHPYSAEQSSSRSSSINSPQSGHAQSSSKRESMSSAYSVSTVSTSGSRTNGFSKSRHGGSQRRSMPPPPRPAPNFAPPPTPSQDDRPPSPDTARPVKTSFRDSVAQRALRLSMSSPKPPPSSGLPPRPDEKGFRSHRRSTSNSSQNLTSDRYSSTKSIPIPAGPRPPPTGPLPPPPDSSTPVSRHTSLKQRLRILSAPSSTPSTHSLNSSALANMRSPTPPAFTADPYASQPSTPIGEPITMDPNFLLFPESEPTPRSDTPDRRPLPEPFPNSPELTSLSPPPRRGSRQLTNIEKEKLNAEASRFPVDDRTELTAEAHKLPSLSRRGSVISLIVSI